MKRKNTRGIPKFASGGGVGNEITGFQRQYNPFMGDLPTYGMLGSQQPGAWMFFDDAWLRNQPAPPPSNVVEPPSMGPPVMGPSYDGPDGGGADRYQDDWRGVNIGQAISPDYENLESFAGYNTPGERVIDGPTALVGQAAGFGPVEFADEVGMMADRAAEEIALGDRAMTRAHEFDEPVMQGPSIGGIDIGGRRGAPNRGPSDLSFGPYGGAVPADLTPATNTGYTPADEYVSLGPVEFGAPLSYSDEQYVDTTSPSMNANNAPPAATDFVNMSPQDIVAGAAQAGKGMTPADSFNLGNFIGNATGGMGFGGGIPGGLGEMGKTGAAALGALVDNMPTSEDPMMSMTATEALQTGSSQAKGTAAQAASMFGGMVAPGTPSFGAATSLAEMFGLGQPAAAPGNQVAGPATPGAAIGVAPSMDPLSGLTESQIDALAAGYHDQAPAVGQASPVAGFSSSLEAMQAAAEAKGRGSYSASDDFSKGSTNTSSGGHYAGVNSRGEPVFVGSDKQGATGQDKGDTGDNGSGSGKGGEDNAGKDSNSDTSGNSSAEGGTGGTGQGGGSGTSGGSGANGTSGGSGDDGGMGAWKKGGRVNSRGLPSMADQVAQAGRGKDTVLAHITPKEAMRLDAAMGGPSINPETGLREYGFFDDVGDFLGGAAKAVAPIAGGVLGGMFGGPLGAAAGAALGTTLVGGNLQQALLSGGVAGIGAYAAPKMAGGMGDMFGGGGGDMLQSGGGTDAGMGGGGGGFLSGLTGNPLAMVGLGAAGGLGAGYLMGDSGNDTPAPRAQAPAPWIPRQGGLAPRTYRPYEGDYSTYGQVGHGGGWQYYDTVNPSVQYYAEGGSVEAPSREKMRETLGRELLDNSGNTSAMSVLQIAQMAMPQPQPTQGLPAPQMQEPQQLQQPMPPTGQGMMGQWQQQAMPPWLIDRDDESDDRVANLLWRAPGGMVRGPGDGQSDEIPAMLSSGEFVVSSDVVSALGRGDNSSGADKLDQMMANVRRHRNEGGKGLPPQAKSPLDYMGR